MFTYSEEQQKAIQSSFEKDLVISASAGSGKTAVLVERLARYVTLHPENEGNTLALSFTVKSAKELRNRLQDRLGRKTAITATNLHAYSSRLLRRIIARYPDACMGYTSKFQILGNRDQEQLLKEVSQPLFIDPEDKHDQANLDLQSNAIRVILEHLEQPELGKLDMDSPFYSLCKKAYDIYTERKMFINAMDFSDLITLPASIIENSKEVAEFIQDDVRCVIVDEYQDINASQARLLKLLQGDGHATYCGDSDQAIFAFRGASPEHLITYAEKYDAELVLMNTNFRSTTWITSNAQSLIYQNTNRIERKMVAHDKNRDAEYVNLVDCLNSSEEAEIIATSILKDINNGTDPAEIAVLFRTNNQRNEIEDALNMVGIRTKEKDTKNLFESEAVKTVLGYLKMASNEFNSAPLKSVCSTPLKGLGPKFVEKVNEAVETLESNVHTVLSNQSEQGSLVLFAQLKNIQEQLSEGDLMSAIDYIYCECGVLNHYEKRSSKAVNDLNSLKSLIESEADQDDADTFLESLALDLIDDDKNNNNTVSLLTIHASKGLEFDTVYFAGFNKHHFPHPLSNDIEEERRLGFVAMTRARKTLNICVAKKKHERSVFNMSFCPRATDDFYCSYMY